MMINIVKMLLAYPTIDDGICHLTKQNLLSILYHNHKYITGFISDIVFWERSDKAKYRDKTFDIYEIFNIDYGDIDALTNKLKMVDKIKFTKKELTTNLIKMNNIYKTFNEHYEQNIQKKQQRPKIKSTKTQSSKPKNKTQKTDL